MNSHVVSGWDLHHGAIQRLWESLLKPRWELECVDKVSRTPQKHSPLSRKKAPGWVVFHQQKEGGTAACCLGWEECQKSTDFESKMLWNFALFFFSFVDASSVMCHSNCETTLVRFFAPVCLLIRCSFYSLMYAVCVVLLVKTSLFPSTGLPPWASFSW